MSILATLKIKMFYHFLNVINIRNKKLLEAFGQHIKKLREEKGLSQSYLANIAGIERSQIVRIENGEINTTISTIEVLAEALEVARKELVDFKF